MLIYGGISDLRLSKRSSHQRDGDESFEMNPQYLNEPDFIKRRYQQLWCIFDVLVPARLCRFDKLWHARRLDVIRT
jgi:hypothetical protein